MTLTTTSFTPESGAPGSEFAGRSRGDAQEQAAPGL